MLTIERLGEITQFRMSQVINGVPVYWVAAYLVDGALIDTGCAHTAKEFLSALSKHDVRQVINTHFHEDHVGANKALQNKGLPLYAHPDSIPLIAKKIELLPYQELVWGYPEPSITQPLPEEIKTTSCRFQVIETPGHSVGHVALFEPDQRWLFSGDIFAREKPKVLRADENIGQAILSMKKLAALPGDKLTMLTSVGKVIDDGRTALQICIAYLEELAMQAKQLHEQGKETVAIVDELFGEEHTFAHLTGGHYSSANLINSLLKTT